MQAPAKYPGHPDFKAPPPAELDVEVPSTSLTAHGASLLLARLAHGSQESRCQLCFMAKPHPLQCCALSLQSMNHARRGPAGIEALAVVLQIGQILFHGRVSKSNRMLPFTTQIIEVVTAHYPPNLPSPGATVAAVVEEATSPRLAAPVADPNTGHTQVDSNDVQLAQQTAFPGLQVSSHMRNSFPMSQLVFVTAQGSNSCVLGIVGHLCHYCLLLGHLCATATEGVPFQAAASPCLLQ